MGKPVNRVLFVNSEIMPFLPETPISKIGRCLPQGIQERKKEIRAFMPRYGCINERKNQLHEVIRLSGMNIIIGDVDRPLVIKVASISSARIQVYFIDNEDYFRRKQIARDADGKFFRGQRPESHLLRQRRAGDRQETALGSGHHPLPGLDLASGAAVPQEGLQRRSDIQREQDCDIPLQRDRRRDILSFLPRTTCCSATSSRRRSRFRRCPLA